MRETGDLLRHMEILFVNKHPDKGMHRSIIDYHLLPPEDNTNIAAEGMESMESILDHAELTSTGG